MIHRMLDRSKEDLDTISDPLVVRVQFFVRSVREVEVDADHLAWEVGSGSSCDGG